MYKTCIYRWNIVRIFVYIRNSMHTCVLFPVFLLVWLLVRNLPVSSLTTLQSLLIPAGRCVLCSAKCEEICTHTFFCPINSWEYTLLSPFHRLGGKWVLEWVSDLLGATERQEVEGRPDLPPPDWRQGALLQAHSPSLLGCFELHIWHMFSEISVATGRDSEKGGSH